MNTENTEEQAQSPIGADAPKSANDGTPKRKPRAKKPTVKKATAKKPTVKKATARKPKSAKVLQTKNGQKPKARKPTVVKAKFLRETDRKLSEARKKIQKEITKRTKSGEMGVSSIYSLRMLFLLIHVILPLAFYNAEKPAKRRTGKKRVRTVTIKRTQKDNEVSV